MDENLKRIKYSKEVNESLINLDYNDNKIIPFEYEYSKWSYDINNFEYNIIYCENKKFVYGDISLETIQKKIHWDLIENNILKFN